MDGTFILITLCIKMPQIIYKSLLGAFVLSVVKPYKLMSINLTGPVRFTKFDYFITFTVNKRFHHI